MPRHRPLPASPVPRCQRKARTYANDGGDEEEHQHGDVEHDDPQQQKQHLGGGEGQNWRGRGMLLSVPVRA